MACRSLGFETGAQIVAVGGSGLPIEDGAAKTIESIACQGDEMSLSECRMSFSQVIALFGDLAVALVCSSASGAVPCKPVATT